MNAQETNGGNGENPEQKERSLAPTEINLQRNLPKALEIAKAEYENVFRRFHEADNKLNMLLAFLAALVAGTIATRALQSGEMAGWQVSLWVALFVLLLEAALCIAYGLFPRSMSVIKIDLATLIVTSEEDESKFLREQIKDYGNCIEKANTVTRSKMHSAMLALGLLLISLILLTLLCMIS